METESDPYLTRIGETDMVPGEVPVETGLTPKEYLEYAISSQNGSLTREAILDHTGWGEDVVDGLLSEMEAADRAVRVACGRVTLVCLPDAVPGRFAGGEDGNGGGEESDSPRDPPTIT